MDKCSRCGGNHENLFCMYYKTNIYSKSNIVLQTSKLQF